MDLDFNSTDPREILYFLYESMFKSKSVNLHLIDKTKMIETIDRLRFSDIENEISYPKDDAEEESFNISLPVIDEQALDYYKDDNLLPPVGYFTKLRPKIIKKPYGLLEIEYKAIQRSLNSNDNRHLKDSLLFSETGYFLFDYEENIYLQVSKKKLEQSRFEIEKGRLELDDVSNDLVKEYLIREFKTEDIRGNVKPIYKSRSKDIFDLKKLNFDPINSDSVRLFLKRWEVFLDSGFEEWLLSKYVYSIVNEYEFNVLKREGKRLLDLTKESTRRIDLITDDFAKISNLSDDYKDHKFIFDVIVQLTNTIKDRLGYPSEMGYLKLEDENGNRIVIENFIMIENRMMKQEEKITEDDIEKEKKFILEK